MKHQIALLHLTLMSPSGNVRFQLPFVILPSPDNLVILPIPDNLVILGQATLWEALRVDVMQALKQSILKLLEAAEDGDEDGEDGACAEVDEDPSGAGAGGTECGGDTSTGAAEDGNTGPGPGGGISTCEDGEAGAESRQGIEELDSWGSEASGVDAAVGPVLHGRQTVQLTVDAFSDALKVVIPDQTEEEVVKDNLLSCTPRVFIERDEELRA